MDQIFAVLQQGLSGFFAITVLLGLLIFVHELGHFLVARWFNVRVDVFSLGFGKRLFEFQRGDTTYCISAIPLGGYVKMFGDDPTREIPQELKSVSYLHKPVMQRIAVVLAGPLMNFFFAIFLFFIIAQVGEETVPSVLGSISKDSKAYQAGFRSGDEIRAVDGRAIKYWEELSSAIQKNANRSLEFSVHRKGESLSVTASPSLEVNPNILSTNYQVGLIEGLSPISKAPIVGISNPQSPAWRAGLRSGAILEVNGAKTETFRDLREAINSKARTDGFLKIGFVDGFELDKEKSKTLEIALPSQWATEPFVDLGFEDPETFVADVSPSTPAAAAGILARDKIVKIKGQAITQWREILKLIKSFKEGDKPIAMTVLREGQLKEFSITPKLISRMNSKGQEEKRFQIGIRSAEAHLPPKTVIRKFESIPAALVRGFDKTWHFTSMVAMSFVRLFRAEISTKNIGGVITISQAATETFQVGITQFLQMMAIISINLFLINLLPIPLLDGGHLLFYTIEALRGAPLSLKKMEMAQQVGLVILVSLMVLAFFNDISRIMKIEW